MTSLKRPPANLTDVARAAGVSTATVSRCLNNPDKVSPKTKARVMEAVEALHYTPNFGARKIAAKRSGMIAAIIPTMENSIFAKGIETFQQSLTQRNAALVVASSAYDPEQEAKLVRTLVGRGADGMLLIGTERNEATYDFLQERNIPFLTAWARTQDPERSFVGFDNRKASEQLVSKAIQLGHTTFAYISGSRQGNDRARDRVLGAQNAIRNAGLDPEQMPVLETEYAIEIGRLAFDRLMRLGPLPSLVICGNDVLAVGAILGAQAKGLKVPDDVSIVGFDDIDLATVINPAITTVHVPHSEMGRIAGDALLDLIDAPETPQRIELTTHIVERASLKAP